MTCPECGETRVVKLTIIIPGEEDLSSSYTCEQGHHFRLEESS